MSKQQNKTTGNAGETLVAEYLQQKDYTILQRNYRSKWGEVDIVARCKVKGESIVVFVEVKTKSSDRYGEPWEMVNHSKIEQVKRMGEAWCREFGWEGRVRVDVIGVWVGEVEKIEHWESVDL